MCVWGGCLPPFSPNSPIPFLTPPLLFLHSPSPKWSLSPLYEINQTHNLRKSLKKTQVHVQSNLKKYGLVHSFSTKKVIKNFHIESISMLTSRCNLDPHNPTFFSKTGVFRGFFLIFCFSVISLMFYIFSFSVLSLMGGLLLSLKTVLF